MLPRNRIVSAILLGVGLALLVWGIVTPRLTSIGENIPVANSELTYTLTDEDATSLALTEEEPKVGPVERQLHVQYTSPITNEEVTARVGISTRRTGAATDLEGLLTAEVYSYRLNRMTGMPVTEATVSEQLASPVAHIDLGGLWFAFPPYADEEEYPVYDATLRESRPAIKTGTEMEDGREYVTYEQHIAEAGDADELGRVLYHEAQREFTVDHATGVVVNVAERVADYYEGERQDVLLFDASLDPSTTEHLKDMASSIADPQAWTWANRVAAGVGGILAVVGIAGVLGAFGRRKR